MRARQSNRFDPGARLLFFSAAERAPGCTAVDLLSIKKGRPGKGYRAESRTFPSYLTELALSKMPLPDR